MLDTGFTGFLAINKQDLEGLYWQFLRKKVVGIFAFGGEFLSWYFDFEIITMALPFPLCKTTFIVGWVDARKPNNQGYFILNIIRPELQYGLRHASLSGLIIQVR
ncbi:MAG: hypothetical protein HEQ24_16560 [Dolichospermum sp. BR01]|jgi:hypothetical protein|nr:hypothetical protein [Dolichospermum sp. BR01]